MASKSLEKWQARHFDRLTFIRKESARHRPRHHAGRMVEQLELRGAVPVLLPATEIAEPLDLEILDNALKRLQEFDWVVFTSVNGVEAVARRMAALQIDDSKISSLKIAVVGPTTGEEVTRRWKTPDAMPTEFISDSIAEVMPRLPGQKVLLPRGDLARPELSEALGRMGATVLDIVAYRIVRRQGPIDMPSEEFPDAITVMSGESARATVAKLRDSGLSTWLDRVPIVCIGPVTAGAVETEGFEPAAVAQHHTIDGLIEVLEAMFSREQVIA